MRRNCLLFKFDIQFLSTIADGFELGLKNLISSDNYC